MIKKNKAYKFRLYPNKEQSILIGKTIGSARFIYNKMLADKIEHYKETKQMLFNTPAQYKEEFAWLKEVDKFALGNAQLNLEVAYKNFFRAKGKIGFPKFKSKHRSKLSYKTNITGTNIRIENKRIKLPKLGFVKFDGHREIEEEIKSVVVTQAKSGRYFISVLVEYEVEEQPKVEIKKGIGLDYSSSGLYVDSQDNKAEYAQFYRKDEKKLGRASRRLAHKKMRSNNYQKQKIKVAKIHETIANKRIDFLHKLSTKIAEENDLVAVEDLDMKSLSQCLRLGKSTMDNGFGKFREMLKYKLEDRFKHFVVIDKWYPSSKRCNDCGEINKELRLKDRSWVCSSCGSIHDRDYNAAKNILEEGIKMAVGTTVNQPTELLGNNQEL